MNPVAVLWWSLDVTCPNCQEEFDLNDVDHEYDNRFAHAIFNNEWDTLKGSEVDCPKCDKEFAIEGVEY